MALNRRTLLTAAACLPAMRPARAAAAIAGFAAPGPCAVAIREETWRDAARARDLPVRLYLPDGARGRGSLVLFSHGLGGSRAGSAAWLTHWAGWGYLAIALGHPGSDASLWRGRLGSAPLAELLKPGATVEQAIARLADARFALDEIARRRRAGAADFAGLDAGRVGMGGHSFGAGTTLALAGERYETAGGLAPAGRDPRIIAALPMSPAARGAPEHWPAAFGAIPIPVLVLTGERDGDALGRFGVTPENRRIPFAHMPPGEKFMAVLAGADHMFFAVPEHPVAFFSGNESGTQDRSANTAIVQALSVAFWEATLAGDPAARAALTDLPAVRGFVAPGEFFAR